jgi:tetratricopeptide (TPR) repeat protein
MAQEREGGSPPPGDGGLGAALALNTQYGLDPRAAAYLEEQTRLARLQAKDLEREDKLRHWSLRVRHVSDVMKLAFEISGAIVLITLVVFLISAIWTAANDSSLVIEAFSVPPEMAARGLTGQAIAAQLQDKLSAMQSGTDSARPETSYANNWGDDIKVEIPNTGVSIGEFYRYLAKWLGHQTHITGEVYRTKDGAVAVTARTGDDAATITGPEANLDKLMQAAAEKIYRRTQPYRYAIFLGNDPLRVNEEIAILRTLANNGSPRDRVWAHIGLSTIMAIETDPLNAPAEQAKDLELAPDLAMVQQNMAQFEGILDHAESALRYMERAHERFLISDGQINERARLISVPSSEATVAAFRGDYQTALQANTEAAEKVDYSFIAAFARESMKIDHAALHETAAAERVHAVRPAAAGPAFAAALDQLDLAASSAAKDWPAVLAQGKTLEGALRNLLSQPGFTKNYVNAVVTRQVWPYVARAMAMTGDVAGARALIAKTPPDCYNCALNRANIAAAAKDWRTANTWFVQASKEGPSIPFAYSDWAEMLLRKGDLEGAIAKFSIANRKGPHFADPLEMWGEALIAKNRSDLALAKFEEAGKYAPNWGRLHLKWGEALLWSGKRDEAKKKFARAAALDLTPSEKSELAKVSHGG